MDIMKKVADRHGMVCLLHEKPFGSVSGSGKHNNYALATDTGVNLLNPGDTPIENAQFLLFLTAFIAAVDEYQELLRVTVAYAANDHRLGASEAPPAIMSIFLGDELNAVIESIVSQSPYESHVPGQMKLGVHILPKFPKDSTDRNRTSPFAFTGNKFEFRSLGSSQSISGPNVVLNSTIADTLMHMADELENAQDFTKAVDALIRRTLKKHMRIIFNGNGYDQAWVEEAERRGLSNLRTTVDALPHYVDEKNIAMFERQHVYTRVEVESRCDVKLETYVKTIDIEALSTIDIARRKILPAAIAYAGEVAGTLNLKRSLTPGVPAVAEESLLARLTRHTNDLYLAVETLDGALKTMDLSASHLLQAQYTRDHVVPAMNAVRAEADALEMLVGAKHWPLPTYQDILTSI